MAVQTWDTALVADYSRTGVGNNVSQSGQGAVAVVSPSQHFDVQFWDGVTWAAGAGDNISSAGQGAVAAENATWYTITGTVGASASGAGDNISQSGEGAVTVRNPTGAGGFGDNASGHGDYAPFPTTNPPQVAGSGNNISQGVGNVSVGIFVRPFSASLDRSASTSVTLDRSTFTTVVLSQESDLPR